MKRIYSNIDPSRLILAELKRCDIENYRTDLSPAEEFLQVSGRKIDKDFKLRLVHILD